MSKEKNDLTLKIFAFIIAISLWGYVMSEVNPERSKEYKNIELTLSNVDVLDRQGLIVMEPKDVKVNVRVSGKKSDMANFSSQSIKAKADVSGYSEGQKKVPIDVTLDQVSNIRIEDYEPREILFTFDRIVTKEKNVSIQTAGSLNQGYVLGDLQTKSQTILLKGPRTWVNEVSDVVVTVDLKNRKEDGNVTLPIKLLDDQGNDVRGVEKEPGTIDVSVPILRTTKLPIELQTENQLPENYEITEVTIDPNTVAIKGDKSILNLSSIQTKKIDINDLIDGIEHIVELDLPEGVQLLDPTQKIKIKLKIEESTTMTLLYKLNEIDIMNIKEGLSINEEDFLKDINISIKGNKSVLETLTKEEIQLYIDLKDLDEGSHQIYIQFNVPTGIIVKEIIPQPIELRLILD